MAADSRTSMGDFIANRASRKISPIHDRIFVLRSGSAADTQESKLKETDLSVVVHLKSLSASSSQVVHRNKCI